MDDPNRQILEAAARVLLPLLDEVVFVGGCATGLLITDPAAGGVRPTTDVDVITETSTYVEYNVLSERLRAIGLTEDNRDGAPTCRWRNGDMVIDIMPTDANVLGFTSRWYQPAMESANEVRLGSLPLRLISPVYFVATKIEAFHDRGMGDYLGSHDLEDLMAVVDGRPELVDEIGDAGEDVRTYVAVEVQRFLKTSEFLDALPGYLPPDAGSQARQPIVLERLERLAVLI